MKLNNLKSNSLKGILLSALAAAVLTLGSTSAFAQHGGGGGGHMGGGGGGHMGGGGGGHVTGGGGHLSQPLAPRSGPPPAAVQRDNGAFSHGAGRPEFNHNARSERPGFDGREFDRRNLNRGDVDHRDRDHRDGDRDDRGDRHHRDHDFDRGFGVFYGDPFFYGYPYDGYPYSGYIYPDVPYAYPDLQYSNPGPTYGNSAEVEYGGISFAITPSDARVYVDNNYVGIASAFGSGSNPLSLPVGSHQIELRASGYAPMSFDATVVAGQVIPYQASLQAK